MKSVIKSLFILIMIICTTSCIFYTRNTFTEMESIDYIKQHEEFSKTLTTIYQVRQDFSFEQSDGLYLTYGYTDFYENHFISYEYGIFNLHNPEEAVLISMKIGMYKEKNNGETITLRYTRNYDFDFKFFYPIDYKDYLNFYNHYVHPYHYIENTYGDKKITITFTTPDNVLTDNNETSYFQITDLKVQVSEERIMN